MIIDTLTFYYKILSLYLKGKIADKKQFTEDYNKLSSMYNKLWIQNMGEFTAQVLEFANIKKESQILDLACGTGYTLSLLKENNHQIKAVDISKYMLSEIDINSLNNNVLVECNDIMNELHSTKDSTYDLITCNWALPYVDRKLFIKETHRVLKPGGEILLISNRKGTIKTAEKAFLKLMSKYSQHITHISDISLTLPKGIKNLTKEFKKCGYINIKGSDKSKSFNFNSGKEAADWIMNCGAMAGTLNILNIPDINTELGIIFDENFKMNKLIEITHKFTLFYAQKEKK